MSDKCCPRADVVSTHFEGCHTVHPECAAYKAGREAGMREAANIAHLRAIGRHGWDKYDDEAAILAAIGEGK